MMSEHKSNRGVSRRTVLKASALGVAAVATGGLGLPRMSRAAEAVKIGLIHPVTGFLSYSGNQCRAGAMIAVEEINEAGGIKSLGGAMLEPLLADAQSKPEVGAAEVEKLNEQGVAAIVGAYASSICLATTQAAAKHGIPHLVDVGVSDKIVTRGLSNVFRFGPGYGTIARTAVDNLATINDAAGKPAKTVMIIHEESLFGTGTAGLLQKELPAKGFEVLEVIKHANPTRDFTNIVLKIKSAKPDLVIPANYFNEYVLLARTMRQQRVQPKGIYSVLGGAASSFKFVKEFPEAAQYIMDCNHWYDPNKPAALELRKKVEDKGLFFTYEVFLDHQAVHLLAAAIEQAGSADRDKIIAALAASQWDGFIMPYGPTKFVDGQNQGARPVNTQVLDGDIEVIYPQEYASAKPVFPMPT